MKRRKDIRKHIERLFDIIVGKTKATDLERVKAFESLMTKAWGNKKDTYDFKK